MLMIKLDDLKAILVQPLGTYVLRGGSDPLLWAR